MIQLADDSTKLAVREMWKICFNDSDAFMDIYFNSKYRNKNTLVYIDDNKPVASLQVLIYNFTFHGVEIPIAYLSGLCTLPEYRKMGYMGKLITKSYDISLEREIPLMLLVPQDDYVINYYEKFGFIQTFDEDTEILPELQELIVSSSGDILKAYKTFDSLFRKNEMTVQKSFDDFETILDDAKLFNYPPKNRLKGMARIIDVKKLVSIYARRYPNNRFILKVNDSLIPENNRLFSISQGKAEIMSPESIFESTFESDILNIDINELAQMLLGYHTSEKTKPFSDLFPETKPAMHFMLE